MIKEEIMRTIKGLLRTVDSTYFQMLASVEQHPSVVFPHCHRLQTAKRPHMRKRANS